MDEDIYSYAEKQGLKEGRITDACSGISPLGPSKKMKAAIRKAVKKIGRQPDPHQSKLRKLFHSKYGLPGQSIFFGGSLTEIINSLFLFRDPGRVLVVGPASGRGGRLTALSGDNVSHLYCEAPLFVPDAEKVKSAMGDVETVIVSNPDRISGRTFPMAALEDLLRYAAARDVLVVVDETLMEFSGEEGLMSRAPESGNLVVLRTTSNFYGLPGLELAYAVASEEIVSGMEKFRACRPAGLALEAAGAALKDRAYRKDVLEFIGTEKDLYRRALKKVRGVSFLDSESNIFLLRLEEGGEGVLKPLKRAGFFLRECGQAEGLDGLYLSVSVMAHAHNLKFLRVIREGEG